MKYTYIGACNTPFILYESDHKKLLERFDLKNFKGQTDSNFLINKKTCCLCDKFNSNIAITACAGCPCFRIHGQFGCFNIISIYLCSDIEQRLFESTRNGITNDLIIGISYIEYNKTNLIARDIINNVYKWLTQFRTANKRRDIPTKYAY